MPLEQPDRVLEVGFARPYGPAWQGGRDQALSIFPDLQLTCRDDIFLSVRDSLSSNMINVRDRSGSDWN